MTQQVIHCKVEFKSLDAEIDNPSIGFTFEATGSDPGFTFDGSDPITALISLFDGTTPYTVSGGGAYAGVHPLGYYISAAMSRLAGDSMVVTTDITAFLGGGAAGPPLRVDTFQLSPAHTNISLPEGCAIGIAWRAPYGSAAEFAPGSRPRARYRNRCYFGPLDEGSTLAANTNHASRVDAGCLSDIDAMMALLATNNTLIGTNHKQWDLVAWSRKDAMVRDAEFFARSERFDYQRRRTERITNESWQAIS